MLLVGIVMLLPMLIGPIPTKGWTDADFVQALAQHLTNVAPLLTLVAMYGVIGADIRQGHYRFLFAKPLSPAAYYLCAFVAATVSFAVVQLVTVGIFGLFIHPAWSTAGLLDALLAFVVLGGVIFALSRLTRLDWLIGFLIVAVSGLLRRLYPAHQSLRGDILNVVLPPSGPKTFFPAHHPVAWGAIAWAGGYAAVCVAVGLVLVRRLPLGSSR